jgi:hypothetical protein
MEIEPSVSFPSIRSQAIGRSRLRAAVPTANGRHGRTRSLARAATIVAALLIEAILILVFVVASLGLGYEGYSGTGPDRPLLPPLSPAPAPPPDPIVSP